MPTPRSPRNFKRLFVAFVTAAAAGLLLLATISVQAASVLWSSAGGSAWLTGTNWTGNAVPNGTDVAQFGANPTAATGVGINFNGTTNAGVQVNGQKIQEVGAVEVTPARAAAFLIGNSSTTAGATGMFRLNGATVNGVADVIIRNNSNQTLTIQNTQNTGTQTMGVILNDATVNIINIDGTGGITISSVVSGTSKKLSKGGAGSGVLTLSGVNTYSGDTTVNTGTLALSGSGSVANSPNIVIGGGAAFDVTGLTTALTLNSGQGLKTISAASTANVNTSATKGLTTAADSPLQFTLGGGIAPAPLTINGAGALSVQSGNPVTVNVSNGGVPLIAGSYTLISKGASGSVTGSAPSSVNVVGDGIAPGTAASVSITGAQLVLNVAVTSLKYRSKQTGNWNSASTWESSADGNTWVNAVSTPTSADDIVNVRNTHIVTVTAAVTADQLTVNSGGILSVNNGVTFTLADGAGDDITVDGGGIFATAGTVNNNGQAKVNGTLRIDDGGFPGGGTGTYAYDQTTGTLLFNNTSGTYGVNNNNYWPTSNGPQNVSVGTGGMQLNVARTVGISFDTSAGIFGANNLTIGANGTLTIFTGGFFSGSPTYGAGSTLKYSTGGSYGRNGEWLPNVTSGAGYPVNVQLSGNTNLDLPNGSSNAFFQLAGNLTIDGGSTLNLNGSPAMTQPLNVLGNVTNNGTLTLSTSLGGDIKLQGNWQDNGTFNTNSRAVFFEGTAAQTINRTPPATETFDYLLINKTSNGVQLNTNVAVNATLTLGGGNVTTGSNTLNIGGAGAVTRTSGYVIGTESKTFSGAGGFTFDVGTANGYSPVEANVTLGAGSLSVKPTQTKHPGITGANALARYWTLSGTGITADLTFHYLDGDVAGDDNNYQVFKYDGAFSAPSGQSVNAATNSATVSGVSSFSDWTLAEPSSVFPTLSGTKTVCAVGCDYVNLTGALGLFADINATTVDGNIVAQVAGDLTEDGTNALNQWTESGTGGYTLSIVPADGTTKTISGNVAAGMIRLDGADRVTIDGSIPNLPGRFLTFRNTNPSGATIALSNDASDNTIRSSDIEGSAANVGSAVVFFGTGATTGNDNNTVTDNRIRDRSDAPGVPFNLILSSGTVGSAANSNGTVSNNELFNFQNCAVSISGLVANSSESWTITGNDVYQTAARPSPLFGISLSAAGSNTISGNTIHDLTTNASALRGINLMPTRSGSTLVSRNRVYALSGPNDITVILGIAIFANDTTTVAADNNMVSIVPATATNQSIVGLLDQSVAGTEVSFRYNTVLVGGTANGSNATWACVRNESAASAATWRDNICFNDRTGGGANHFAAGNESTSGTFSSDYNLFVGTGGATASDFMDYGTANTGTPVSFATWQSSTGGDANSPASTPGGDYTVANMFTLATDLHLNTSGTNPASNAGTPLGSVTNDFDDETRDASIPDIGADEVTGASSLQFSQAAYGVGEGAGTVTITVTRTGSSVGAVSVTYSTGDGTAEAGSDYVTASGTLEWEAGDLGDKTFDVTISDDPVYEGDEIFNVTLGTTSGGAILGTPNAATVSINENDSQPTLSVADVTKAEGDSGQTAFEFTVTKSGATNANVTVDYATEDCVTDPATGGASCGAGIDYVTTSGPLTFAPGETEKTVTVQVCGDTDFEPDEDFFLNLSNAGGATLDDNQAEGIIQNDDAEPPPVSFSIDDVSHAEGNADTTAYTFTVTKTGTGAASVNFATADATAEAGSDYATNSGTLSFAADDTTKQITVNVNGDTTPETDETFSLVLSGASGADITDDTGEGTISNDDESVSAGQLIISEFRLRGPGASEPPIDLLKKTLPKSSSTKPSAASSPCGASHAGATTSGRRKARALVQSSSPDVEPDESPEANDEFIELYNNTDTPLLVTTTDGSEGWAVAASDGLVRFIVPNGTVIPPRAHFLSLNLLGYSLYGYPAGDGSIQPPLALGDFVIRGDGSTCFGYELDIPDNAGIALFRTSNPSNFDVDRRLDAAGSTAETNALYKEGAGYPALAPEDISKNLEHSFYRSLCSYVGGTGCTTPGVPKDTNDNAADFLFVDTEGTQTAAGRRLGAPGPENLASNVQSNAQLSLVPLDRTLANSAPPNRVRDFTEDGANNSTFGTLSVRRRVTNNTGSPVTSLRFRIVELTSHPSPPGTADLRVRDSADITVTGVADTGTCSSSNAGPAPCDVTVQGTTLEQPPSQPNGGGFNSSLAVGTITFEEPLEDGESVNVQFLLGIQQTGTFRFLLNIEAVTDNCSCPARPSPKRSGPPQ